MDRDDKILSYVQDTMRPQDRVAFDAEIATDASLAAEIAALMGAREVMVPKSGPDVEEGWAQLSAAIDQTRFRPANENRPVFLSLVQVASVAVASVLLWQVVVTPLIGEADGTYVPASATASATGPELQVTFTDTATFGEVSGLLNALDATIVSGPGALGIYKVTFDSPELRQAAQDALAARSDLIVEVLK
jgi:hypothetical protein